jgi:hypothetical protein
MSIYALAFLLTALAVAAFSLLVNHLRGAAWVMVIVANMAMSNIYRLADRPFPDAFMAGLDLAVIALIYYAARHRWELWLWLVVQFSALVSILHLATYLIAPGWIDSEIYLLLLELCNYAAVILIGGVGGYAHAGRRGGAAFRPWPRIFAFGPTVRAREREDRW